MPAADRALYLSLADSQTLGAAKEQVLERLYAEGALAAPRDEVFRIVSVEEIAEHEAECPAGGHPDAPVGRVGRLAAASRQPHFQKTKQKKNLINFQC